MSVKDSRPVQSSPEPGYRRGDAGAIGRLTDRPLLASPSGPRRPGFMDEPEVLREREAEEATRRSADFEAIDHDRIYGEEPRDVRTRDSVG